VGGVLYGSVKNETIKRPKIKKLNKKGKIIYLCKTSNSEKQE
jgi:hypothetical protein